MGEAHTLTPDVSFVFPARDEAASLGDTLESIRELDTAYECEIVVVDGGSRDGTAKIGREYGASVLEQRGSGIAEARNQGAASANGEWLAFVDADTILRPTYLTELLGFAEFEGVAGASSYCRVTGPMRAKAMEVTINHLFSRLRRPILPGFNTLVHRDAFEAVKGYPTVPNEDTAFSRRLAREYPLGYRRSVLVETSGRRVAEHGLTGTLTHYARLDRERLESEY